MLNSMILYFALTDIPRSPSNLEVDPLTKQVRWKEVPGYGCLPKSHFVVEYKKSSASRWTTAGYFDNRTFDLVNPIKGQEYVVKVYARNSVGKGGQRSVRFWTNSEFVPLVCKCCCC